MYKQEDFHHRKTIEKYMSERKMHKNKMFKYT